MPNGLKIFEERVTGGERDRGMDREIDRDRGGGKRKRENHSFDIHKYVFCMLSLSTIYSMKMGFHENHIEIQSHSISSIHCFDNVYIFFFLLSISIICPFSNLSSLFFSSTTSILNAIELYMHSSNKAYHSCVAATRNTI